jgi:hypothetical protein
MGPVVVLLGVNGGQGAADLIFFGYGVQCFLGGDSGSVLELICMRDEGKIHRGHSSCHRRAL